MCGKLKALTKIYEFQICIIRLHGTCIMYTEKKAVNQQMYNFNYT